MRSALFTATLFALAACGQTSTEAVDDPDPTAPMTRADSMAAATDTMSTEPMADATPQAVEVARGAFSGASGHDTSGQAVLYRLASGEHVVRLEGFETDNGPALEVWMVRRLSGAVAEGGASLGALKSTNGNQNYPVPAGLRPEDFAGVSIWCERFSVNFGTAPLAADPVAAE